ncbi:MAG: hypothetical protein ACI9JM_003458 [Halioglobus sp.]|jgi:hypothetical protein
MIIRMLPLAKLTAAAALLSTSTVALAGGAGVGSVTHVPFETHVPMLGGAGLVVLAALLGIIALRFMKNRETSGSQFLVLALAVGTIASGASGLKLINDANAISGVQFSDPNGSNVSILSAGFSSVYNDTGFPQKITDISVIPGCTLEDPGNGGNGGNGGGSFLGTCNDDPGTILERDDSCDILVVCILNGGNGGVDM